MGYYTDYELQALCELQRISSEYIFKGVYLYYYRADGKNNCAFEDFSEEIGKRLSEATGLKIDVTITEQ